MMTPFRCVAVAGGHARRWIDRKERGDAAAFPHRGPDNGTAGCYGFAESALIYIKAMGGEWLDPVYLSRQHFR
jgi:hypothetical protein